MAVNHYENFPVASFLLPQRLRPAVEAIYHFARTADDFADEGDAPSDARLSSLRGYLSALNRIENGLPAQSDFFAHLGKIIRLHNLPLSPFRNLISAFMQDVVKSQYADFDEVLDYCSRSANPVGYLVLHLYEKADARNLKDSNAICSALQLINFWQDVAVDLKKNRVYVPLDSQKKFQIFAEDFADANNENKNGKNNLWKNLMRFEVGRARSIMLSGASLPLRIPGRLGFELRLVVLGGLRILEKIESSDYDVFNKRPTLKKSDWFTIVERALRYRSFLSLD